MKTKQKRITDYIQDWHKAILAILFFVVLGSQFLALAGNVKQQEKEIIKINLWRINQLVFELEDRYKCYSEPDCLKVMSESDKLLYRKLIEERKDLENK